MADSEQMIAALDSRVQRREDRRAFFKAALGAAAVGGAFAVANSASAQTAPAAPTDAEILNFALNLEYLEANFYYFAVNGTPIPLTSTTGQGTFGAATGGSAVKGFNNDPLVAQYAREIANDELAHVNFLRSQLGSAAVAQPLIDLGISPTGAFSSAARAAGIIADAGKDSSGNPLPQTSFFDPYASPENFLLAAFIFEDVGVTAYKGASPLLTSKAYLDAAAGILAAEAYHASIVRTVLDQKGIAAPSLMLRENAEKISNARDLLDGTPSSAGPPMLMADDDQGITPTTTGVGLTSNIAPTDNNAMAFSRSTGQVLNIVYLKPPATASGTTAAVAATSGGFFPNGVNGTIKAGTTA
jgi:hypothetical protein